MTQEFYKAFEDKHRGSRELIKGRLEVYLPFLDALKQVYPDLRVLDLGCGRGEWLELLREHAIEAEGVDLDAGMLSACHEAGLRVTQTDALEYLKGQSDQSIEVISAFHVVEHIPFLSLQELVEHALRVLRPGGLLIMETPNPENLTVGTSNFYKDPTHTKPIPPLLLDFLPEFYGFARQKVLGLQEPEGTKQSATATLSNVLNDVSPDYAVVAQSPGTEEQIAVLDEQFALEYGVTLEALAHRFDQRTEDALSSIQSRLEQAGWNDQRKEKVLSDIESRLGQAEQSDQRTEEVLSGIETRLEQAERYQAELAAVYASKSWRITRPLRMMGRLARSVLSLARKAAKKTTAVVKKLLRPVVLMSMRAVLRHPGLKSRLNVRISRYPRLHRKLTVLARNAGLISGSTAPSTLGDQHDPVIQRPMRASIRFVKRHPRLKKKIRSIIGHFPVLERWLLRMWAIWQGAAFRASSKSRGTATPRKAEETSGVQTSLHPRERSVNEALGIIRAELKQTKS